MGREGVRGPPGKKARTKTGLRSLGDRRVVVVVVVVAAVTSNTGPGPSRRRTWATRGGKDLTYLTFMIQYGVTFQKRFLDFVRTKVRTNSEAYVSRGVSGAKNQPTNRTAG